MKFTRQSRLLRPTEFKRVFQHPERSTDTCFRIMARVNDLHHHRLGLAVSKKACSGAVKRNRIKRIIRESFRRRMGGEMSGKTMDFVVLPTAQAKHLSNRELDISLKRHWQRLICKAGNTTTGGIN